MTSTPVEAGLKHWWLNCIFDLETLLWKFGWVSSHIPWMPQLTRRIFWTRDFLKPSHGFSSSFSYVHYCKESVGLHCWDISQLFCSNRSAPISWPDNPAQFGSQTRILLWEPEVIKSSYYYLQNVIPDHDSKIGMAVRTRLDLTLKRTENKALLLGRQN